MAGRKKSDDGRGAFTFFGSGNEFEASIGSAAKNAFVDQHLDSVAQGLAAEPKFVSELAFGRQRVSGMVSVRDAFAQHLLGKPGLGVWSGH